MSQPEGTDPLETPLPNSSNNNTMNVTSNVPKKLFLRGGKIVHIPRSEVVRSTVGIGSFPRLMGIRQIQPMSTGNTLIRPRFITPILTRQPIRPYQNSIKPGIVKIEMTPQGRRIVHTMERPPITNVVTKNKLNQIITDVPTTQPAQQTTGPTIITMSPRALQTSQPGTQFNQVPTFSTISICDANKLPQQQQHQLNNQSGLASGKTTVMFDKTASNNMPRAKPQFQLQLQPLAKQPTGAAGAQMSYNANAFQGDSCGVGNFIMNAKLPSTPTAAAACDLNDPISDGISGINDITYIAGIDLHAESNAALNMGSDALFDLPSIEETLFLNADTVRERFRKQLNTDNVDEDVINLISVACEEDLKNLIERLCVSAEHRSENLRADSRYLLTKNVRGQLQFLKELEEAQERNAMDFEKLEDGRNRIEQAHKAELREQYRRDTENTAMQAILGAKKRRVEEMSIDGAAVGSSTATLAGNSLRSGDTTSQIPINKPSPLPFQTKRIKYVTKQDALFVLEQEPSRRFRQMLYELHLK